jgi:predicted nucleotidyltransferase
MMTLHDCLRTLHDHKRELGAHGIRHAAVCGRITRGEEPEDGCLPVLADIDRPRFHDAFMLPVAEAYLERLLGCRVELNTVARMRADRCAAMLREAVHAF